MQGVEPHGWVLEEGDGGHVDEVRAGGDVEADVAFGADGGDDCVGNGLVGDVVESFDAKKNKSSARLINARKT